MIYFALLKTVRLLALKNIGFLKERTVLEQRQPGDESWALVCLDESGR